MISDHSLHVLISPFISIIVCLSKKTNGNFHFFYRVRFVHQGEFHTTPSAAVLCMCFAPTAAGPVKLKAYRNGIDTPSMFGASTLIVKASRASQRVFCYQWKMACMPDIQVSHDSSNVKEYSKVFSDLAIFSKSFAKIIRILASKSHRIE